MITRKPENEAKRPGHDGNSLLWPEGQEGLCLLFQDTFAHGASPRCDWVGENVNRVTLKANGYEQDILGGRGCQGEVGLTPR